MVATSARAWNDVDVARGSVPRGAEQVQGADALAQPHRERVHRPEPRGSASGANRGQRRSASCRSALGPACRYGSSRGRDLRRLQLEQLEHLVASLDAAMNRSCSC